MKGGGRGKEPLVAGEVAGKRPKRKCLQWHPLLSKKALDFSEEEEEEDEEELDKVSAFETFHLLLYFCPTKANMKTTVFCGSAASSRCCVAQSRACRCNVEAQRRRRRRTPTSKGPGVR